MSRVAGCFVAGAISALSARRWRCYDNPIITQEVDSLDGLAAIIVAKNNISRKCYRRADYSCSTGANKPQSLLTGSLVSPRARAWAACTRPRVFKEHESCCSNESVQILREKTGPDARKRDAFEMIVNGLTCFRLTSPLNY